MTEEELNLLIRKHLTGSISGSQKEKLKNWLDESTENRQTFEMLLCIWKEKSVEPQLVNTEAMIDRIWHKSHQRQAYHQYDWNYFLKVAAVIIFLIVVPLLVLQFIKHDATSKQGIRVANIIKNNPVGQKARFYLPDGTLVWLNGASTLQYSSDYNETHRNVKLTGEAFFEVASNENIPFVVESGNITTTALGTAFNVEAYPEDGNIEVSLLHGKVKVHIDESLEKDVLLDPGYQLQYSVNAGEVKKQPFTELIETGWKDGILVFYQSDYHEVVQKLEYWYGIDVITEGEPQEDWRLTTTYKNESLRNVLKNLRFSKNFKYNLGREELRIQFSPKVENPK